MSRTARRSTRPSVVEGVGNASLWDAAPFNKWRIEEATGKAIRGEVPGRAICINRGVPAEFTAVAAVNLGRRHHTLLAHQHRHFVTSRAHTFMNSIIFH